MGHGPEYATSDRSVRGHGRGRHIVVEVTIFRELRSAFRLGVPHLRLTAGQPDRRYEGVAILHVTYVHNGKVTSLVVSEPQSLPEAGKARKRAVASAIDRVLTPAAKAWHKHPDFQQTVLLSRLNGRPVSTSLVAPAPMSIQRAS